MQRLFRFLSLSLFAGGLVMVGDGLYIWSKAAFGQILLERSFSWSTEDATPVKPWTWADMGALAKLKFPRLGKTSIVLSESHGEALAWGPGHMRQTPLPGDAGTSIIAGHRDTHFQFLGMLKIGDEFSVSRFDGHESHFRVISRHIVDAYYPGLDINNAALRIALVTCWPLNASRPGGDDRLVLMAERIDQL